MESLSLLQRPTFSSPKLIKTVVSETTNDSLFDGMYRFYVDNYNNLNRQWIKATFTIQRNVGDVPITFEDLSGLLWLKQVTLSSHRGTIQKLDPVTMIARMGLIYGTPFYYKMIKQIANIDSDNLGDSQNPGDTVVLTVTSYIPLFWFFSDIPHDCLSSDRGSLMVNIRTNSSLEAMGISGGQLLSANYELYSNYGQTSVRPIPPPKPVPSSYNSFIEDEIRVNVVKDVPSTVRLLLKCPYNVFYTHFYANKIGSLDSIPVISVKIEAPSSTLFDSDVGTNSFDNGDSYDITGTGTFSVKFGERHDPDGEYIKFSQTMSPTYATVVVVSKSTGVVALQTVCEYRTIIDKDESGNLYENVSGLFDIIY